MKWIFVELMFDCVWFLDSILFNLTNTLYTSVLPFSLRMALIVIKFDIALP